MSKENLFFCYTRELYDFLINEKKLEALTVARHIKTNNVFSIFAKSEELQNAIREYKSRSKT